MQKASLDSISNLLKYIHSLGDRTKDSILVEMKGDTKLLGNSGQMSYGLRLLQSFWQHKLTAVPLRIAII